MVEGDGTAKEKVLQNEEEDVLAKLRGGYKVGNEYEDDETEGGCTMPNQFDGFGGEFSAASVA